MNRLAQITFTNETNEADLGNNIGYLEYVTGEVEALYYPIIYSTEHRPLYERLSMYVDDHLVKLKDYVSEADLERAIRVYFDYKVSGKTFVTVTCQLQDCYQLCV